MNNDVIYFDNNATTRVLKQAAQAMMDAATQEFGNPVSAHRMGLLAERQVTNAREKVAAMLGADPNQVIFTGSGTESSNLALRGVADAFPQKGHMIVTKVEHSCVRNTSRFLKSQGWELTELSVDENCRIDLQELKQALRPDTRLVSIMLANNETGVLMPVKEACAIVKAHSDALFHTDAVQVAGKMPINFKDLGVDLLGVSAHKFYGPMGVGALVMKRDIPFRCQLTGGGQEFGLRSSTHNVPGIAGMGVAAAFVTENLTRDMEIIRAHRDRLQDGLLKAIPGAVINCPDADKVPNTLHMSFPVFEAGELVLELSAEGICVSSGSACQAAKTSPSHVLSAMGLSVERVQGSIRISLGLCTKDSDIDRALEIFPKVVALVRGQIPTNKRTSLLSS